MNADGHALLKLQPDLIERRCGGWLATTPKDASIKIGVIGQSKEDAAERFAISMREWVETVYKCQETL